MNAKVKDSVRILHILDAIKEIEDYIQGADKDSFANNTMMFNATLHQLEIIGEAANGLSDEYISNHPGAPWARIIGLRNSLFMSILVLMTKPFGALSLLTFPN